MQTFMTSPDWVSTARHLDYRRLGEQRLECKQILAALGYEVTPEGTLHRTQPHSLYFEVGLDPSGQRTTSVCRIHATKGWVNHPCTKMWRGYHEALAEYQRVMIEEWVSRGYNNTMLRVKPADLFLLPHWYDDERVYASHRSNLLRKAPEHYGKFGWSESSDIPYFFPEPLA